VLDIATLVLITGAVVYLAMHLLSRHDRRRIGELKGREERFRGLTELSADWFWETDAEHRITWLSGGGPVATLFGATPTFGKRFWEIPGIEVEGGAMDAHRERLAARLPFFDLEIARADARGARQIHIISGQSRVARDGAFLGYRGVGRDVTEQRRAERRLAEAKTRLELALDGGNLAEWHFDVAHDEVYAGDGWVRFLGHDRSPPITLGAELFEMLHAEDREGTRAAWVAALKGEAVEFEAEFRTPMRDGTWKWLHARGRVTERDADGRALRMSGTVADIDGRRSAEARAEHLATRDALTGLPNRARLADRANQAIAHAVRGGGGAALLVIGLDRFGLVNEALGHAAGDAVLQAVVERLQGVASRGELARLGGDEFALLCPELRSAEEAATLARRILGVLARPVTVDHRSLAVGASIGIALYPRDGRDVSEVLKNATAALSRAKTSGGGTFSFFAAPMAARADERLRVENDLRGALARGELALHWHPVVRTSAHGGDEVVGAEALVRWNHPERGLLLPEEFVPLAEDCGLIGQLGEWTLERAISQAAAWQRTLPRHLWFAVNVSAPELAQGEGFIQRLRAALDANGVDGARMELEITERTLMTGLEANAETMRRAGELGVRFAIDDFGTGYSSLAYLRGLPVDKLKIDRAFLRAIDTDPTDEAIVRTITALARTLGVAVAAEGVERPAQLERLLALGCDEWQGHCFSEPLAPAEFERLFAHAERRAS